ncbi:MAG: sigma-70 family RNA polymerase sigma factor [Thaumarchaeota archaeon]|nr:sigma-70 family RNA polymerase sigma factor [Nitrososphaerota archaeon]
MDLVAEQVKKGGPYTKKEQDERRQEVFKLHFEKGYSAIKISEMLNVNRNTINEDIKYWRSELAEELNHDVVTWAIEQFHSFESQKNRLVDQLEKEESIQSNHTVGCNIICIRLHNLQLYQTNHLILM